MSHSAIKAGKWEEGRILIMKMSVFPNNYPMYGGPASKMWLNIAHWREAENNFYLSLLLCGHCPVEFWISTGMDIPQPFWKTCTSILLPFHWKTHLYRVKISHDPTQVIHHMFYHFISLRIVWLFFSVPQRLSHCKHQKGLPGVFLSVGWTNSVLSVSPCISLAPWIWSYALWPY